MACQRRASVDAVGQLLQLVGAFRESACPARRTTAEPCGVTATAASCRPAWPRSSARRPGAGQIQVGYHRPSPGSRLANSREYGSDGRQQRRLKGEAAYPLHAHVNVASTEAVIDALAGQQEVLVRLDKVENLDASSSDLLGLDDVLLAERALSCSARNLLLFGAPLGKHRSSRWTPSAPSLTAEPAPAPPPGRPRRRPAAPSIPTPPSRNGAAPRPAPASAPRAASVRAATALVGR